MPDMLDAEVKEQVKQLLGGMHQPITLVYFTQENACSACRQQYALLSELQALSDRIRLEVHELRRDADASKGYGVDKVPATVVRGERDHGIRFFGVTTGYEFASLLEAILMVSTGVSGLAPEIEAIIRRIDVPTHIEIMVTLTCPYCARMVRLAHQFAFINDHLRADMIDAAEFPQLTQRYQVAGVPLTVVNERRAFEGALQPVAAAMEILKVVRPADYERLDQMLREARGERRITYSWPDHVYDVLIVDAGPAAMTATIYAVRKGLDVALIGERAGGQVTDTAVIENWPGMAEASSGRRA